MTTDQLHIRNVRFDAVEASTDGRTIEGYSSVWDSVEEIRDWAGHYYERFARGSFLRTLTERGPAKVRMLFDHGYDALVGGSPIGVWEDIHEDDHGLYVRGRLLDSWHVAPVQAAIEAGAIDGMSVRFRPVVEERDESGALPVVTHQEVKLLEAGPVVWQAFSATEVGVRSGLVLDLFRAMLRGESVDLARSPGAVAEPDPVEGVGRPAVLVTRAERRKRAAELRGMTRDEPLGATA